MRLKGKSSLWSQSCKEEGGVWKGDERLQQEAGESFTYHFSIFGFRQSMWTLSYVEVGCPGSVVYSPLFSYRKAQRMMWTRSLIGQNLRSMMKTKRKVGRYFSYCVLIVLSKSFLEFGNLKGIWVHAVIIGL